MQNGGGFVLLKLSFYHLQWRIVCVCFLNDMRKFIYRRISKYMYAKWRVNRTIWSSYACMLEMRVMKRKEDIEFQDSWRMCPVLFIYIYCCYCWIRLLDTFIWKKHTQRASFYVNWQVTLFAWWYIPFLDDYFEKNCFFLTAGTFVAMQCVHAIR